VIANLAVGLVTEITRLGGGGCDVNKKRKGLSDEDGETFGRGIAHVRTGLKDFGTEISSVTDDPVQLLIELVSMPASVSRVLLALTVNPYPQLVRIKTGL
jgi:hypothetical protein